RANIPCIDIVLIQQEIPEETVEEVCSYPWRDGGDDSFDVLQLRAAERLRPSPAVRSGHPVHVPLPSAVP
ncbi:hypothetical protein ACFV0W_34925, partial [Streptomyces anulatus]